MKRNWKSSERRTRLSWTELIAGAALLLIGLILLIWPNVATSVLFGAIGAVGIVIGLVYVVRYCMLETRQAISSYDLALGLSWIAGGLAVIIFKNLLLSLLPFFFGMLILIGGIVKIQGTLGFKRMNAARWYLELIGAGISVAFGLIILFNPFSTALLLMRVIGAALIAEGAMDLVSTFAYKKTRNSYFVEAHFSDHE